MVLIRTRSEFSILIYFWGENRENNLISGNFRDFTIQILKKGIPRTIQMTKFSNQMNLRKNLVVKKFPIRHVKKVEAMKAEKDETRLLEPIMGLFGLLLIKGKLLSRISKEIFFQKMAKKFKF